jgi:hypothetical protein
VFSVSDSRGVIWTQPVTFWVVSTSKQTLATKARDRKVRRRTLSTRSSTLTAGSSDRPAAFSRSF